MQYSSDLGNIQFLYFQKEHGSVLGTICLYIMWPWFFSFPFCSFFFFLYSISCFLHSILSLWIFYSIFVFWAFIFLLFLHHSILFCKDRFRSDVCLFQNYLSSWYWKISWNYMIWKSLQSLRNWALIGPNVM